MTKLQIISRQWSSIYDLLLYIKDKQSARLEALESRDGEKWRTVTSYLLTAILGIAVGIIAKQFGL